MAHKRRMFATRKVTIFGESPLLGQPEKALDL